MTETIAVIENLWAPQDCTLPTAERPLRVAEFDDLFRTAVRSVTRVGPSLVRLELAPDPTVAARAAKLIVRETGCCSFFTFTLSATEARVMLDVSVPDEHADVLDGLARHASSAVAS